jgi:hypothetical protein
MTSLMGIEEGTRMETERANAENAGRREAEEGLPNPRLAGFSTAC